MQQYLDRVLELCEEGTKILSEYVNSKTKLKLACKNNHIRYFSHNEITSRKRGLLCQECKGFIGNKKSETLIKEEFSKVGYVLLEPYKGSLIPHKAKHIVCSTEMLLSPNRVVKQLNNQTHISCPTCDPKPQQRTSTSLSLELKNKGLELLSEFTKVKSKVLIRNLSCGHEYEINLNYILYSSTSSCPICKDSVSNRFFEKIINKLECLEEYKTTQTPILCKNLKCNHSYPVIPLNLVHADTGLICRICEPLISSLEVEFLDFISKIYSGPKVQRTRILEGKEIDLYLPELSLGFELNGLYYHQENKVGTNYHKNKTDLAKSLNIRLIQINEDEWINKQEIVRSRIKSLFNQNLSIPARKCTINSISFPSAFLDDNHMQGAGSITPINYGLFFNTELIAVMTFKKPRFSSSEQFELVRYCSQTGINVLGGASRLFKYFIKQLHPQSIITYSDRRWNTGNLYTSLGFEYSHTSEPNYRYYKRLDSLSRYQCQKHLLKTKFPEYYNESLSEKEIMQNAGYIKITDAGNDVYKLKL